MAWQAAADQPQRFVLSPLRAGRDQIQVDGVDVPVGDLVAASLRRVADEAAQVVGERVTDVRLVVPAGWGPRRRTWMRQVAYRAGLGQPTLVEAPVAVAEHLLALGAQWPVGSFLLVCDLGAGAEVSVLRRGPAGFEVLSTLDDPAAGGFAIDDALLAALPVTTGGGAAHGSAGGPAVRAALLVGKEALVRHPAVTVPMPDAPAMVLTALMVEQAAQPAVEAVGKLAVAAVAAAELTAGDLAGVYCVGAGARLPLVERVLAERLGLVPRVVVDPEVAAVRGAAGAVTAAAGGPAPADERPGVAAGAAGGRGVASRVRVVGVDRFRAVHRGT